MFKWFWTIFSLDAPVSFAKISSGMLRKLKSESSSARRAGVLGVQSLTLSLTVVSGLELITASHSMKKEIYGKLKLRKSA